MITTVELRNYRAFRTLTFNCDPKLNIVVGDNESGKSTLLEAISLAMTKRLNGRFADSELSPHLFNKEAVAEFLAAIQQGQNPELPAIQIEVHFSAQDTALQHLRGSNNLERADAVGIRLEIAFDDDYREEYQRLLEDRSMIRTVPTEYYKVSWHSFAFGAMTARSLPFRLSYIDATAIRMQSGTDNYLQSIIAEGLTAKERAGLAVAFRHMKEHFAEQPTLQAINTKLDERRGELTHKSLELSMDLSQRGSWEASLTPHLDNVPYSQVGKGEQHALKILFALENRVDTSHVILIEEPENHLSFSSMSILLERIRERCEGKQLFVTTHSAYVLNRLGLKNVALLRGRNIAALTTLSDDTQSYFRKLSGYDTLRMILSKRTILVEGPSDALIVQHAYWQRHGRLPISDGVDVLSVRGLSFKRFLEIASKLDIPTSVVTDNDGNYERNVTAKYKTFADFKCISICADDDDDLVTLEDHVQACNSRDTLNKIFGTRHDDDQSMLAFMKGNKTDCALRLFDAESPVTYPDYIESAIA